MGWGQGSYGLEDRDRLEEGGTEGGERVGTGDLGKGPPKGREARGKEGGASGGWAYGRERRGGRSSS